MLGQPEHLLPLGKEAVLGNGSTISPAPHSQGIQAAGVGSREARLIQKPQGNLKGGWVREAGTCVWTPHYHGWCYKKCDPDLHSPPVVSAGGSLPVQMNHSCGSGKGCGFEQLHAFMNVGGKGVQKAESGQNKQTD